MKMNKILSTFIISQYKMMVILGETE